MTSLRFPVPTEISSGLENVVRRGVALLEQLVPGRPQESVNRPHAVFHVRSQRKGNGAEARLEFVGSWAKVADPAILLHRQT